jgi:hypothetical protein
MNPGPVDVDTPLRLADAVGLAFPAGGMSVSGLRREARRGRLVIETIANKQFVTLRAIERMRGLCRDDQRGQENGSDRPTKAKTASSGNRHGLSETERASAALPALQKTA